MKLSRFQTFSIIFIFALLIFTLSPLLRNLLGNDGLIGEISYYNFYVSDNGFNDVNGFSLEPKSDFLFSENISGFHWFIHLLLLLPSFFATKVLPVFLGLVSISLFFLIIERFFEKKEHQIISSVFFIISPLSIISFTTLSPFSLVLTLFLCSFWLFDFSVFASLFVLLLLIPISGLGFIFALLILFSFSLFSQKWKPVAIVGFFGILIVIFLKWFFGFFAIDKLILSTGIFGVFSGLGSSFGHSFFLLVLSIVGVWSVWVKRNSSIISLFIISCLFILSFSTPIVKILLIPVFSFFACFGLIFIIKRPWSSSFFKSATIFVIVLSLVFTLISTITAQIRVDPSLDKIEAISFLQNMPSDEVVLSSKENGFFILNFANRTPFINSFSSEKDLDFASSIFLSQDYSNTANLLREHNISHIVIDSDMRSSGIWNHDEEGLLFLLENSESFINIFNRKSISVYRFVELD